MVQIITTTKHSGSTDGLQILVTATATLGTVIHTSTNLTGDNFDEIWIFADNSDATERLLTIEFGGVSDPGNIFEKNIAALGTPATDGPQMIIPGLRLQNSLVVTAFASVGSVIKLSGWINEIRV